MPDAAQSPELPVRPPPDFAIALRRPRAGLPWLPWPPRRTWRAVVVTLAVFVVFAWGLAPAARAVTLLANWRGRGAPTVAPTGLRVTTVRFAASDGVPLAGWLAIATPAAPTIILVHGSKGSRADMLPYARFLYAAGYNVLLYDSRGCGASGGWGISDGVREPDDVIGAVRYLAARSDLTVKRYGVLGISLGAGTAILAAAREPRLAAVVADSAWPDQEVQIARMGSVSVGPVTLPVVLYELALVDALIGGRLEDARPLAAIPRLAPRAVLLIHAADDRNPTTPLAGERALYAAARAPKAQWIAPSGGHVGALGAHATDYKRQVLAFFAMYLRPGA
ncbi:MAG TPA: alpha/beta fold hydrolase [Ktedonobacterales bacterium]